jgi:hypothetical protein
MNPTDLQAYQKAITQALAANPEVSRFIGSSSPDEILNAYTTGDFSNIVSLSGKPFTAAQQQEAFRTAERALNPGFKAQTAFDTAVVEDTLQQQQQGLQEFRDSEAEAFSDEKEIMDTNAANQGILFTGARLQKQRDLRNNYQDRDRIQQRTVGDNIRSTARNFQYSYGDSAARGLRDAYKVPGQPQFNANVAKGEVKTSPSISSMYNTNDFKFQGTTPVSQKASIQTRAASLLGNKANKLSLGGYKNKL